MSCSLEDKLDDDRISIEICKKLSSPMSKHELIDAVQKFLLEHDTNGTLSMSLSNELSLREHVVEISLYDSKENCLYHGVPQHLEQYQLSFFVYCLHQSVAEEEMLDDDSEELPAANHLMLPSQSIYNVWETLIYDTDIKETLLSYALTGLLFADKGVNQNIISWNRIILLHGPPGTGKTSLCHALAHKLSIRLCDKFTSASLLEVNSHSLFSKWFSESGKLVMKMFKKVSFCCIAMFNFCQFELVLFISNSLQQLHNFLNQRLVLFLVLLVFSAHQVICKPLAFSSFVQDVHNFKFYVRRQMCVKMLVYLHSLI